MTTKSWPRPPEHALDPSVRYSAVLETSSGRIEADLFAEEAPATVNNFVFLAREGFYDGGTFHRVIEGFVIQGGDPEGTGRGGPGYTFRDELDNDLRYEDGTLAMANAGPNTNGSQFFIVCGPNGRQLPKQYTIFGRVRRGMDVVREIGSTPTGRGDRPRRPVVIERVTIEEAVPGNGPPTRRRPEPSDRIDHSQTVFEVRPRQAAAMRDPSGDQSAASTPAASPSLIACEPSASTVHSSWRWRRTNRSLEPSGDHRGDSTSPKFVSRRRSLPSDSTTQRSLRDVDEQPKGT